MNLSRGFSPTAIATVKLVYNLGSMSDPSMISDRRAWGLFIQMETLLEISSLYVLRENSFFSC